MLLISGLSWNPVPAVYRTVKPPSLYPCKVPVTSPCASPTTFRLHIDIKINQPLSCLTILNYRPDRLPPVLLSSRVMTNQSILYKCAFFYCTLCHSSAINGYVYSYNSYSVPPINRTDFRSTNLSAASAYCTSGYFSALDNGQLRKRI